jgi:hypothetical protein
MTQTTQPSLRASMAVYDVAIVFCEKLPVGASQLAELLKSI